MTSTIRVRPQRRVLGALPSGRRFRLLLRGILVTLGLIAGFFISVLIDLKNYFASGLVLMVLVTVSIIEFVFADYWTERRYPYDTERKLALLEQRLGINAVNSLRDKLHRTISCFKACNPRCISGTVHLIVELSASPESIERRGLMQLTDYVGERGGQKGRITTLEKGIIGRCARTGARETANFSDENEYLHRMIREFGFSEGETRNHTRSARSYLAQPLKSPEGITIGVLYFFSTEVQVFPIAAREVDLDGVAKDVVDLLTAISIV